MSSRRIAFFFFFCLLAGAFTLLLSNSAWSQVPVLGTNCPGLAPVAGGPALPLVPTNGCNSCFSAFAYQNIASGPEIINAMFNTINNVLAGVEQQFFNSVVGNNSFQGAIGTGLTLYVAMYGLMIALHLNTYRINEVVTRLMKVAIVYMMTGPAAWTSFNAWIGTPVVSGMNQLIRSFTQTAENAGATITTIASGGNASLDPTAFSNMFGTAMTTVFSVQLGAAIMVLLGTGFFGWLIAIFLVWALIQFLTMMIGALITYAKAIIGLAFLFGIAPLFFIFLLFDKTRQIFFSWISMVITFALQPVMLFAFLSFYVGIVSKASTFLLSDDAKNLTDFCWTKWLTVPGTLYDMYIPRPTTSGALHPGEWHDASGHVRPSPINVSNLIYFLMICHLGKTFTQFIEQLSQDIAGGIGPGVVRGTDVGAWAKRGVGGAIRGIRGKK